MQTSGGSNSMLGAAQADVVSSKDVNTSTGAVSLLRTQAVLAVYKGKFALKLLCEPVIFRPMQALISGGTKPLPAHIH